jgi:hypothetical protein
VIRWARLKLRRFVRWLLARHDERPVMFRLTPLASPAYGARPTIEVPTISTEDLWRDQTPTVPLAYLPPEERPIPNAFDELEWPEEKTKEIAR